ncbi:MAG TPA: hypothetical protein VF157_11950 [Chloroflexota bacterium]
MSINIEERRRRRDQRLAVEAANDIVQQAAARGRVITLEWAAIAALLALGAGLGVAAWYRHLAPAPQGATAWAGLVLGALLCHASGQRGRSRLVYAGLALFVALPLGILPFRFVAADRSLLPLLVIAGAGAAMFGAGLTWAWEIRATLGTLGGSLLAVKGAVGAALGATAAWLHDAVIKWIFALFLLAIGGGIGFVGWQQKREALFWAGAVLVFLVGSVGLWAPGLYKRTPLPRGLRHCGQLCFWLSLLVVPFVEAGPSGGLPYNNRPSWRFLAMGLGLVVIGATWFLQRQSIFSHAVKPEPKHGPERTVALAIVVLGLVVTLAGAEARERMKIVIDQSVVSQTGLLGAVQFEPASQVRSLSISQPIENVPIFLEEVEFEDGSIMRLIPTLYPGEQRQADEHGLVQAVRAGAQLNSQSLPTARVEQWSRGSEPRG